MRAENVIEQHYIGGSSIDTPLCVCGKMWEPRHVIAELREAGYAVVRVPDIAFKSPYDTNGSMLISAADNAERCYPVGGSNVGRAVAQVLREVAAAAD